MTNKEEHLKSLQEIKMMMEKSSKFISLSGLSGISAGICGLAGAAAAYVTLTKYTLSSSRIQPELKFMDGLFPLNSTKYLTFDLVLIACVTLGAALILSTFFTARRAKKNNHSMWNSTSKRLLVNMALPLVAGGLFCLILLYHGLIGLVAPCTLIFFGLALVHGSKFTLPEIQYVGAINILLGLVNGLFIGHGLLFWALGFGVVNIIYGVYMYFKYDRIA